MDNDFGKSIEEPPDEAGCTIDSSWRLPNGMMMSDISVENTPFPPDVANLSIASSNIGDRSSIVGICGDFYSTVAVSARHKDDRPILAIRMELSGNTSVQHSATSGRLEESPERYSIVILGEPKCLIHHQSGARTENFVVTLTAAWMQRMLAGNRVPSTVQRFIDGQVDNFGVTPRLSADMRGLVGKIRVNPYTGGIGALYRQSRVCDLLVEALSDLDGYKEGAKRVIGADQRKAMEVRDLLMADLANPPSVEALAGQVGLSQRRLNEAFRDIFGLTVFEWLVDQRLTLARDLLRNGDLSVKEIAYRLGYVHPNNFTKAFTRRFGRAPGRFR